MKASKCELVAAVGFEATTKDGIIYMTTLVMVGESFGKFWQRDRLADKGMGAVAAEIENSSSQDVVTNERNCVPILVPNPFAYPFTDDEGPQDAGMLETWAEGWLFKVAIERPTVRQYVHLFATGAPVRVTALAAAQRATYLTHRI